MHLEYSRFFFFSRTEITSCRNHCCCRLAPSTSCVYYDSTEPKAQSDSSELAFCGVCTSVGAGAASMSPSDGTKYDENP